MSQKRELENIKRIDKRMVRKILGLKRQKKDTDCGTDCNTRDGESLWA